MDKIMNVLLSFTLCMDVGFIIKEIFSQEGVFNNKGYLFSN